MGLFNRKKNTQKRLDAAMLAINSILNEIYSNKSTDEYKMKGDITKSPSYKDIEKMVTDLRTLKGYNQNDANDLRTMFQTLHRPVFKTMVKEYIMEHNDRNTIYTSLFTIGYRLLVGELARIFASTEATPKGIIYKPNKVSRKNDASKMIRLFNAELEKRIDEYIKSMNAHPEESPVNESYLEMICDNLFIEADDETADSSDTDVNTDDSADQDSVDAVEEWEKSLDPNNGTAERERYAKMEADRKERIAKQNAEYEAKKKAKWDAENAANPKLAAERERYAKMFAKSKGVQPFKEEDLPGDADPEDGTFSTDVTQEADAPTTALGRTAEALGSASSRILTASGNIAIIATSVAIIGGLFGAINGLLKGFNPIADINYHFMDSYDKKIRKFENVSKMYEETKKAYDEYMRIPEAQRNKKVESKYMKNMDKYNITMQNLAAQIEHFNQRAKKESESLVNDVEKKLPTSDAPKGGDAGNTVSDDDDFQF